MSLRGSPGPSQRTAPRNSLLRQSPSASPIQTTRSICKDIKPTSATKRVSHLVVDPMKPNKVSPTDQFTMSSKHQRELDSKQSKRKRRRSVTVDDVVSALKALSDEDRFLVRPDMPALQNWDFVIFLALIFTAIVTPYEVAFVETELGPLFVINRCVDLLFISDMILQFFLMYYHENGRLVKSHTLIRRRYMRGWFAIDFLTVLPFDMAKWVMDSGQVKVIRIIRLLRLFKLLRIVRASRIFTRWETKLGIDHGSMMYIKLVLTLSALTHWIACMWGLFAFIEAPEEYTWMSFWLDSRYNTPEHCKTNVHNVLNGAFRTGGCYEQANLYIACIQLAVMTITGSGPGGDVMPVNTAENFVVALLTMIAGVQWANIIGQICGIAASGDPVQHQFYQIGDDLNRLMRETHIEKDLRQHIRLYLRHSKTAMRERARKEILQNLSPELSGQMAIKGQRWIKEHMVFWVSACSPTFLSLLIIKMDCEAFAPKEIIPANDCMYILKKGTVMTSRLMMKSSQNTCWNVDFVLTTRQMQNIRSMVTGRTLSFVEVDMLSLDTFQSIMEQGFPECETIRLRIRWWAVLRVVQCGARLFMKGKLAPMGLGNAATIVTERNLVEVGEPKLTASRNKIAEPLPGVSGPSIAAIRGIDDDARRGSAPVSMKMFIDSQQQISQKLEEMTRAINELSSGHRRSFNR